MPKAKRKELKSYLVTVEETVTREYVVDAEDEDDARANYGRDAKRSSDVQEIETIDWEVKRVEINE
jgi:hypothetical protein